MRCKPSVMKFILSALPGEKEVTISLQIKRAGRDSDWKRREEKANQINNANKLIHQESWWLHKFISTQYVLGALWAGSAFWARSVTRFGVNRCQLKFAARIASASYLWRFLLLPFSACATFSSLAFLEARSLLRWMSNCCRCAPLTESARKGFRCCY